MSIPSRLNSIRIKWLGPVFRRDNPSLTLREGYMNSILTFMFVYMVLFLGVIPFLKECGKCLKKPGKILVFFTIYNLIYHVIGTFQAAGYMMWWVYG